MLGQHPGPQERSCRGAAVTKHDTDRVIIVSFTKRLNDSYRLNARIPGVDWPTTAALVRYEKLIHSH